MGGIVAAATSAMGGMGGGGLFSSLLSTVVSSIFSPDPPSPAAPPAPPAAAPAPQAPTPAITEVKSEQPVVDTEAARVRAAKRRKASEDKKLFSLSSEDTETSVITKSILGD